MSRLGDPLPVEVLESDASPQRVGEGLLFGFTSSTGPGALRVLAPEGVLMRGPEGRFTLVEPKFKPALARSVASFMRLGLRIRDRPDPRWLRVRAALLVDGTACWVTDPAPPTLADTVAMLGRPPPNAVLAFAGKLAEALDAFHEIGPHLDISPETLGMIESQPILMHASTDRRLLMKDRGSPTGAVRPGYSAPEQFDGLMRAKPLGAASDVHAASAVLHWLITGAPPPTWTERRGTAEVLSPGAFPAYPRQFIDGINAGLSVGLKERPESVPAWLRGLGVLGGNPAYWTLGQVEPPPERLSADSVAAEEAPNAEAEAADTDEPSPLDTVTPFPLVAEPGGTGGRIAALVGGIVVLAAAAAGAAWLWPVDDSYFASRDVIIRERPDAAKGKVLARRQRGAPLKVKSAGVHDDIPWMQIKEGPFKGAYLSRRNLSPDLPPALRESYTPPKAALVEAPVTVRQRPGDAAKVLGTLPTKARIRQAGVTEDGWTEILWADGGVGYVRLPLARPPPLVLPPVASEPSVAPQLVDPSPWPAAAPPSKAPASLPEAKVVPLSKPPVRLDTKDKPDSNASSVPAGKASPPVVRPPSAAPPTYIVRPRWSSVPSGAVIFDVSPERLISDGKTGRIVIDCEVATNGSMRNCSLVSEDPPGYNLRGAAQRLLPYYRMESLDRDGQATAGRRYRITIRMG